MEVTTHKGETITPGAPLLLLGNPSQTTVTVYIAEPHLGRVHLGQHVAVTVDSFPYRVFEGQVSRIAEQAEFTPKNVSTKEGRRNTFFAVEIRVENPDLALKSGMPADVTFH